MIQFFAEDIDFPEIKVEEYQNWLVRVATNYDVELEQLTYVFCSDEYLLEINKEHLNHDYYTDIITFPLQQSPLVSDLFISLDRVSDNAKQLNIDFELELRRVMVHGLLHLVGFDDKTEENKLEMREEEDFWISF